MLQLVEVGDPALADCAGNQPRQARIAEHHPASRRHAIGLVLEFLGPQLVEIAQHVGLQQLRVQRRHAIDGMAAHAGQVRHAHIALAALVDQRHARQALLIAQEADAHGVEEARIDLVDDLQVSRQHAAEQVQRPALQRLGQQRVVGVGEGARGDRPGLVPGHHVLIDQQAHQLRDRDRRMRVVELDGELLVEVLHRQVLRAQDAEHVLQRTGDEEVLLLQPQLLALQLVVVRIQHLAEVLRRDLAVHRAVRSRRG